MCVHSAHLHILFENDRFFTHLSSLERELSFRTEMVCLAIELNVCITTTARPGGHGTHRSDTCGDGDTLPPLTHSLKGVLQSAHCLTHYLTCPSITLTSDPDNVGSGFPDVELFCFQIWLINVQPSGHVQCNYCG